MHDNQSTRTARRRTAASDLWMKSRRKHWGPLGRRERPRALGPLPPTGVEVEDRGSQANCPHGPTGDQEAGLRAVAGGVASSVK